jgi:hypothetical protein
VRWLPQRGEDRFHEIVRSPPLPDLANLLKMP